MSRRALQVRAQVEPDDQWRKYALCKFIDNAQELFFPADKFMADKASRLCEGCPVRLQCDEFATTNKIMFGVWGGRPRGKASRDRATARLRVLQIT